MRNPLYFLLLVLALPVVAAKPAASHSGLLTRVWQSQDGLPGNVVRSVVQSSDGYLWVATAEGVARFDGFEFELVEPGNGDLRRGQLTFSRLFAGSGGRVWATTFQGGLFRSEDGQLKRILSNVRQPQPLLVTQLIEEDNGTAYLKRGEEFSSVSRSGKVSPVEATPKLRQRFEKDLAARMEGGQITDLEGNMILHDQLGGIWTAGPSGGLSFTQDGQAAQAVALPQIGQSFGIHEMIEDREGNIWLACHVNGLARVRRARVEVLDTNQGAGERAVTALMQDRAGVWWLADRRGGVTRWTPEESRFVPLTKTRSTRRISALFEDRDSRLWAASQDGSVFRFDGEEFQPQFTQTQVPSKVRAITQDEQGTLWFGGFQGIATSTGKTVRRFGRAEGVEDHDISVLQPFPGGRVIAGSTSGAVLLGDARGFETIGPDALQAHWISGILPVSAKETWISTLGGGLWMWDGENWFHFDVNDGLPDSRLTCVVDDGKSQLWMGSLSGIIRAERAELLARIRSPQAPVQWLRLDHTDGLPSRECIGGFQPAGWRASDGLVWFPTGNGVARVRPDLVTSNQVPPAVFLRRVRANGVQHRPGAGPVLADPGRARLEFHFIGLSFSAPEKVTYRTRLAGLDDSWREIGSQRVASFEAVPPGDYTFEVMAVNGDGLRSTFPARIPIIIKPHFWETAWFYLSVGGFILAVAMAIGWTAARLRMKDRITALKVRGAREGERSRIARDLHDDLGASLTEISILSSLAAEDSAESQLCDPLHQLSIKAKHAVGRLDEIVWAVNPRQDNLRSLVDYISAFAREFLDLARIPLRLDVIPSIPEIPLATTRRHGIFLAAREAINNIVKHSRASEVLLHIGLVEDVLAIRIEDNGRGFALDYAEGGNGLENLKQRMRDAGGDCRIESRRGHGTTVLLTLPLKAADNAAS